MMKDVYLVIGVPASGKSWACNQLKTKFEYVHHDGFIYLKNPAAYLTAVRTTAMGAQKPLLIEAPFSMGIMWDLEILGYNVTPIFILEKEEILRARYKQRERVEESIIQGHLTRQETFRKRAIKAKAFMGDSTQVFNHLDRIK
jgi:hypothetical protein